MPVGVTRELRFCKNCNQLRWHTMEYHYFPDKKVIKTCRECSESTTSFHGSGKQ